MEVLRIPVPLDYEAAGLDRPAAESYVQLYLPDVGQTMLAPEKGVPVVVLCPGGAYQRISPREAEPVALRFAAAGMAVAVLHYAVAPSRFPTALMELAAVIKHLRQPDAGYPLRFSRVVVCGFSAGGHLAASVSTLWQRPFLARALACESAALRPDGSILAYPVITGRSPFCHVGSLQNLYGSQHAGAAAEFSLEEQAGEQNPEAFIWHTWADESVPVENSMLYAMALRRAGVPFELHVYPEGGHGLSLGNELVGIKSEAVWPGLPQWIDGAVNWVRQLGRKSEGT